MERPISDVHQHYISNTVWCGTVQYTVRYSTVLRYGITVRYGTVRYGTARHSTVQHVQHVQYAL